VLSLGENITREEALAFLATSAIYGNLGLFVGAGLSKAVLSDESGPVALSWGELLDKTAQKMVSTMNQLRRLDSPTLKLHLQSARPTLERQVTHLRIHCDSLSKRS
jgi:hypothetical protein